MDQLDYLKVANYSYATLQILVVIPVAFVASFYAFLAFMDDSEILELVYLLLPYFCPSVLLLVHAFVLIQLGRSVQWGGGRILQTLLNLMNLCAFPLGTAWAVYSIWVMWINAESAKEFVSDDD